MSDKTKTWEDLAQSDNESSDNGDDFAETKPSDSTLAGVLEHPSYKELEAKLTEAEQKAHENLDKAMRAMSEADNVRRRAQRDVENAHKYAVEKFASDIIHVVDSIEHALQAFDTHSQDSDAIREGMVLTHKLMIDTLAKHSIQCIDPMGEVFDPHSHEAMSMVESADAPPNTILVVIQKGYRLNDRVIRPARVMIAKAPQA